MSKPKSLVVAFVLSLGLLSVTAAPVAAAAPRPVQQFAACSGSGSFFGFPSWDACLAHDGKNPKIESLSDVWRIAFPLVESIIRAAAYVAVIMIIWGGIKYIQSQGDAKKITAAKSTILNAVIGLLIAIFSVAIVRFVADRF